MSTWSVEIRSDQSVFDELAPWWNQCPGPRSTPFLRSEWFRLWCDSFLPDRSRLEVVLWKKDGSVVAALPLSRSGLKRSSLANSHTDVFDLVASPDPEATPVVSQWLARRPITRMFRLDGRSSLVPVEPDAGWLVDRRSQAPFVDLSKGSEGLTAGLGRNLKKNLRRLERRTAELGEVVYLDNADGVLPNALEQCMKLEASGWKGNVGTAMISHPQSARFYHEITDLARERGWLRLCALLVAERLVAFELDLDLDRRRFSLKAGFDQEMRHLSPGKVLQLRVLESAVSSGLVSYEFGGEAEGWKLEWTNNGRSRMNVLRFGNQGTSRLLGQAIRGVAQRRADSGLSDDGRPNDEVPSEL